MTVVIKREAIADDMTCLRVIFQYTHNITTRFITPGSGLSGIRMWAVRGVVIRKLALTPDRHLEALLH